MLVKKIITVSQKGITYKENKEIKFIDFKICNRNWKEDCRVKGKSEEYVLETVCVGERGGRYFIFYTEPRIMLEFKRSLSCLNPRKLYNELYMKIIEMGWSTYDIS